MKIKLLVVFLVGNSWLPLQLGIYQVGNLEESEDVTDVPYRG